ncbi:hypothetical protein ACFJIV_22950 [Mucilaginibacter sp. UC70_90]
MWVEIAKNTFESNDSRGFYFILNLLTWNPGGSVSRYNVYVDSRDVDKTENYRNLSIDDKKLLDEEFDAFITSNGKVSYLISEDNNSNTIFNLEEAIRFFIQPLSIILENNKNDASFIRAIIYHFDQTTADGKQVLVDFMHNGWLQFENAGGCTNVENFIEGKLQSFNELAAKNNSDNHKYLRCIVILDSDTEFDGQPKKSQYLKLESYLHKKNITNYHFLEKRMMENYMPNEVVNSISDKSTKAWIDVYNTLSDKQKDYLNYKSGFSKEKDEHGVRKPIKAEILALYPLDKTNFDHLDTGLNYANFKENFPSLFESSGLVNKFTLKNRANSDELERILAKLKNLI